MHSAHLPSAHHCHYREVMSAQPSRLRIAFQEMLNLALTRGSFTANPCGLGPATIAAIDAVALEHPDAEAASITNAYDAFQREHGHFD
jgi:hypothetical protein